jgi:hypothetical protein
MPRSPDGKMFVQAPTPPGAFAFGYFLAGLVLAYCGPILAGFLGLSHAAGVASPAIVGALGFWRVYADSRYGRGRAWSFAGGAVLALVLLQVLSLVYA